jgi:general stress protein 26
MRESAEDLAELQALLDRSRERSGPHQRLIFEGPGPFRHVDAPELAERLTGMRLLVVGTVGRSGQPRVSPVDGHFHRGGWFFSTPGNAFRLAHLRANPAISAVHTEGERLLVQVHGTAELVPFGGPGSDDLDSVWQDHYGASAGGLGDGIHFVRIHADRMVAYAWDDAWSSEGGP